MALFEEYIKEKFHVLLELKKEYWVLLIVYFISAISVFRTDYGYVDDIGRILTGNRGWDDFSRYLNQIFSIIIQWDFILK